MATNAKLTSNPSGESVDVTLYRSMIGCLLYLTTSRPDIAFSVGVCSRFQSNPKVSPLNAIKRIIKYVGGTCDYELFYSKESNLSLAGFSDSDWAGNVDDRKSTTGGCFYVEANPKVSHLNTVKRIIKYVGGTCDYGLFYSKESNLSLAGFSDFDWAGNVDDRKSTTGGCFYVEANLVAWMSKRQNYVSLSIAETEYIAAGTCCL